MATQIWRRGPSCAQTEPEFTELKSAPLEPKGQRSTWGGPNPELRIRVWVRVLKSVFRFVSLWSSVQFTFWPDLEGSSTEIQRSTDCLLIPTLTQSMIIVGLVVCCQTRRNKQRASFLSLFTEIETWLWSKLTWNTEDVNKNLGMWHLQFTRFTGVLMFLTTSNTINIAFVPRTRPAEQNSVHMLTACFSD